MIGHFALAEFLHSDTALASGIENHPSWAQVANLRRLAFVLEEVRGILGDVPIIVTSGFRCPTLNQATGGADNSAHLEGLACDFVAPDFGSPREVCKALEIYVPQLDIDQLILEFNDWTHLGLSEGAPRHQCLTIDAGGTTSGFG